MTRKSVNQKADEKLIVGIDLGTSRSAISAHNGKKAWIESYVGWPKDFIASKFIGEPILFGNKAIKHRLSLDLYRPLKDGVIKEGTERDEEAVKELVGYLISLVKSKNGSEKIRAVVGVPADSFKSNKLALKNVLAEYTDSLLIVSEPFAVAYGIKVLDNALVIDIGAGTVDFCIMHGSIPSDEDQRTILTAGDYIDQQLFSLLEENYPDSKFNLAMIRSFKEQHSFVGKPKNQVSVEMPIEGVLTSHDITEEIKQACESILPAIVETTLELVAKFDPEYQEMVRKNIIISGGGSQIEGLAKQLEKSLAEYGSSSVTIVDDPLFGGANGALALAKDMPEKYWVDS